MYDAQKQCIRRCRSLHPSALPALPTSCCCFSITQDSYPAIAGDYSTWVPPYSYASMDQLEETVGYKVNGTCLRNATLQQLLVCPAGQESLPANELADHCQVLNVTCPPVSATPPLRRMQLCVPFVAWVTCCLKQQAQNYTYSIVSKVFILSKSHILCLYTVYNVFGCID